MEKVYAFDFDGTLTRRDTLLAFIRYARGRRAFWRGFLRYMPLLLLMRLHLYPNWKAKQKVFAWFFRGMPIGEFNAVCLRFARDKRRLLRPQGMEFVEKAATSGIRVLIVSASIDNWVAPFFSHVPVLVLGTRIEVEGGRITGRFLSRNCYGQEKVNRIRELFPVREDYELTAFGDSRGDREMLRYADRSYYKPFR